MPASFATGHLTRSSVIVKEIRATTFAPVIRALDRLLPVPALLSLLFPIAWIRASIHGTIKGAPPPLPNRWLGKFVPQAPQRIDRLPVYLNRTLEFISDRLDSPKWQRRCRFVGLEQLHVATGAPCGAILAFVHFGQYGLLREWLRAAGHPVSMLVGGNSTGRSSLRRRKDAWALFPDIPNVFYQNELPAAINHAKAGRPLAIAVDVDAGNQVSIPAGEGFEFVMATGAIRFARRHQLPLIAVSIYTEHHWRFVVELSAPISMEPWERGDRAVATDLLEKFMPALRRHPDQCTRQLCDRVQAIPQPVTHVEFA